MTNDIIHIQHQPNRSKCGRWKMLGFMFVSREHAQEAEKNGWRVCKQCKVRIKL